MKKIFFATLMAIMLPLGNNAIANDDNINDKKWIIRLRAIDVHPDGDSRVTGLTANAHVDNKIVPEIDLTYFWTKNIATEIIAATSKHDVSTNTGIDLGSVWALPPTITLQYHLNPEGQLRPYVGAGLGYMMYHNTDSGAVNSVKYDNGIIYALQAGMDIGLNDRWAINFDVKKMFHNTNVSINGGAITADVDLDPWVFGTGIAYRF